jgi:hypothetical protein
MLAHLWYARRQIDVEVGLVQGHNSKIAISEESRDGTPLVPLIIQARPIVARDKHQFNRAVTLLCKVDETLTGGE